MVHEGKTYYSPTIGLVPVCGSLTTCTTQEDQQYLPGEITVEHSNMDDCIGEDNMLYSIVRVIGDYAFEVTNATHDP